MGIKNLAKLIADAAPAAVKEISFKELTGRKIAIDASMTIYQFLVAVRSREAAGGASVQLTNAAGEVTSHLQGMFNRTIRLLENGIKPLYVFDGKPPEMKSGELAKRKAMKERAQADMTAAAKEGNVDDVDRYSKRTVHMTKQHQDDCKQLLRLMGMPVVEAPCEAEAQCAALAKSGDVYAAASEDMDTLTFATPYLIRRLTFNVARDMPPLQFSYVKLLEGLGLSPAEFVDLCILCGCDYCDSIRGIGPKKALKLIKAHGTIEKSIAALDKTKFTIPENFDYARARKLFTEHEVLPIGSQTFKWEKCDEDGLQKFLIEDKGFAPDRVVRGIEKLKKARGKAQQARMDTFFKIMPSTASSSKGKGKGKSAKTKRKSITGSSKKGAGFKKKNRKK